MAKPARLSPIKSLRKRLGLSQAELAEAIEVAASALSKWELTLDDVPHDQLRDLAVVLGFPIEAVKGEVEARTADSGDAPFGTLRIEVPGHFLQYPIDRQSFESITSQLARFDIQDDLIEGAWITSGTLDNKLLFLNPDFIDQIELVCDDAVEMPMFEHPEVYKVLADWDLGDKPTFGPVLARAVQAVVGAEDAQLSIKAAQEARVIMGSGKETWHDVMEEQATDYCILELEASNGIAPNRLLKVRSEGREVVGFVNLSKVAAIEVPLTRYLESLNVGA